MLACSGTNGRIAIGLANRIDDDFDGEYLAGVGANWIRQQLEFAVEDENCGREVVCDLIMDAVH